MPTYQCVVECFCSFEDEWSQSIVLLFLFTIYRKAETLTSPRFLVFTIMKNKFSE